MSWTEGNLERRSRLLAEERGGRGGGQQPGWIPSQGGVRPLLHVVYVAQGQHLQESSPSMAS